MRKRENATGEVNPPGALRPGGPGRRVGRREQMHDGNKPPAGVPPAAREGLRQKKSGTEPEKNPLKSLHKEPDVALFH